MAYNLTTLYAAETVPDLFIFANTSSGGVLMGLFMISIWFVIFFSLKKWEAEHAFLATSWICFVLSTFLTVAGMLNFLFPLAFLVMAGFLALGMWVSNNG